MARIANLDINQINRRFDDLDTLINQVRLIQTTLKESQFQTSALDYFHHPPTTNNLLFTWTGGTLTLSWVGAKIQSKNANAQVVSKTAFFSSAPGAVHNWSVPAGSLVLVASTYYWLGWDTQHQQMIANVDAGVLLQNKNVLTICQLFTGTAGQTGTAGGGGSQSGVDLSGARYKLF